MNKRCVRLIVLVNGVHSFTLVGNVKGTLQLKSHFENWYNVMEPQLRYQELVYLPARVDCRDVGTELSVIRVA